MSSEKISVIIPVYNTEKYIGRCLDSILNNTYKNLEVICVNDGSKDRSLEILNEYAEKDNRVKVIDKENGGVSAARNTALDAATGDFISFVDSDDWIHNQFFEILMYYQAKENASVVACESYDTDEYVEDKKIEVGALNTQRIQGEIAISNGSRVKSRIWGRIYKKEMIGDVRFAVGIQFGEDRIFNCCVLGDADARIVVVKEPIYYYFSREDSLIHVLDHTQRIHLCRYCIEHIDDYSFPHQKRLLLLEAMKGIIVCRYMKDSTPEKKEFRKECKPLLKKALAIMKDVDGFSASTRIEYNIMSKSPQFYRLCRKANDTLAALKRKLK